MTGAASPRGAGSPRRGPGALGLVLSLAAILRLAHWAAVRDAPFFSRLAMDSQEYDRWARAIAAGDWLGTEPFFQAPLYPYLLATVYRLGGSLDAVYLLQIAAAVAGLWALARAGRELGGERLGVVAAALGALYQPFWFYDVQLLKESWAVTLVSFLLWALLVARRRGEARFWLVAGALGGCLALLRENFLLVVPFLLPLAFRRAEGWRPGALRALALVAGLWLPLAPVAARNAALGGGFLPTTSQGGVNFWIGNNPEADGTYRPLTPGRQIPRLERREPERLAELATGRELSAGEVSRWWLARALEWARAEPARFARLQLRKLGLYWSGYEWPDAVDYYWTKTLSPPLRLPLLEFLGAALLAAAGALVVVEERRVGTWAPVLLFELGWMLSTVAFFLFSRYRLPAVPGLLLLAALPVLWVFDRARAGARVSAAFGALAFVAAWAAPHLLDYSPRAALVEYNLGRLYEEAGDVLFATTYYQAALRSDPGAFLPAMNLGNLAARSRSYDAARGWFERAIAAEPRSPEAWSNLGGARLALGDLDGAAAALDRALELDPGLEAAVVNRRLVDRRRAAAQGSGGG